jgi:hypothetical protein
VVEDLAESFARVGSFCRLDGETLRGLAAATLRQDRPEYQFNLACAREFEAETFRLRNLEGVWQRVATVALPVCIAAGIPGPNENHCLSNVARGLAEESGFEFRTVADATHFLQMERPRQCAAIVDAFVTRVLSTRG